MLKSHFCFLICNFFWQSDVVVKERSVSVILLAGGKGKRMGVRNFLSLSFLFSLTSHVEFSSERYLVVDDG